MSAPVITRGSGPRTEERPTRIPTQRRGESAPPAPAPTAAERAYARRDDRARRLTGARPARPAAPPGRAQFVLLVMVLLGTALVATLWLSTAAAADSYRLRDARVAARTLGEQSARLQQQVAEMVSPPALARRAMAQGMVPVEDVARLVVLPDGAVEVVGEPSEAVAPPRAFPSWPSTVPTESTASTEPAESTDSESTETESTESPEGAAAAAALIGLGPGAATADQEDSTSADGAEDAEQDGDSAGETDRTDDTDAADRTGTRSEGEETDTTDSSDTTDTSESSETTDTTDTSDSSDSNDRGNSRTADGTAVGAATAGAG